MRKRYSLFPSYFDTGLLGPTVSDELARGTVSFHGPYFSPYFSRATRWYTCDLKNSQDGGCTIYRIVPKFPPGYAAPHPRRRYHLNQVAWSVVTVKLLVVYLVSPRMTHRIVVTC